MPKTEEKGDKEKAKTDKPIRARYRSVRGNERQSSAGSICRARCTASKDGLRGAGETAAEGFNAGNGAS